MFQIIVKEKGVFTNVISPSTKAKLRLLFEVAPLALLVEKAGGASSCDGLLVSGLDVEVVQHDQRTQICYGSIGEVRWVLPLLRCPACCLLPALHCCKTCSASVAPAPLVCYGACPAVAAPLGC